MIKPNLKRPIIPRCWQHGLLASKLPPRSMHDLTWMRPQRCSTINYCTSFLRLDTLDILEYITTNQYQPMLPLPMKETNNQSTNPSLEIPQPFNLVSLTLGTNVASMSFLSATAVAAFTSRWRMRPRRFWMYQPIGRFETCYTRYPTEN